MLFTSTIPLGTVVESVGVNTSDAYSDAQEYPIANTTESVSSPTNYTVIEKSGTVNNDTARYEEREQSSYLALNYTISDGNSDRHEFNNRNREILYKNEQITRNDKISSIFWGENRTLYNNTSFLVGSEGETIVYPTEFSTDATLSHITLTNGKPSLVYQSSISRKDYPNDFQIKKQVVTHIRLIDKAPRLMRYIKKEHISMRVLIRHSLRIELLLQRQKKDRGASFENKQGYIPLRLRKAILFVILNSKSI